MCKRMMVSLGLVCLLVFGGGASEAHYRSEQYIEAEKGLDALLLKLSTQLNALEQAAGDLERDIGRMQDMIRKNAALAAVEILRHQAMRVWYNRLLFQNLSDEAVSLGQMATIVNLSVKALGPAIYKLERITREENNGVRKSTYKESVKALRSLLEIYKEAQGHLNTVIRSGR